MLSRPSKIIIIIINSFFATSLECRSRLFDLTRFHTQFSDRQNVRCIYLGCMGVQIIPKMEKKTAKIVFNRLKYGQQSNKVKLIIAETALPTPCLK